MEAFLNELQEERNSLHEKLQVAESQLVSMSKLVVAKPAEVSQQDLDKIVTPLKQQISDLVSELFLCICRFVFLLLLKRPALFLNRLLK